MSAERLKQLLRSKWARWAFAGGLVVKLVLLGMVVYGAVTPAQARVLTPSCAASAVSATPSSARPGR